MVAAIISIGGPALKIRDAVGEYRRVAEARCPFDIGEFVVRGFGKLVRKCLLRHPEHIDRKVTGVLENAQARRINHQTPEHERRIERHRGERIAGYAVGLSVGPGGRDDGDAGGIGAERVAKIPRIDRRMIAGQFVRGIRGGRMLGRVSHPPASKRQVFGWQAKGYPSVIGAGRVEIEREV